MHSQPHNKERSGLTCQKWGGGKPCSRDQREKWRTRFIREIPLTIIMLVYQCLSPNTYIYTTPIYTCTRKHAKLYFVVPSPASREISSFRGTGIFRVSSSSPNHTPSRASALWRISHGEKNCPWVVHVISCSVLMAPGLFPI